MEELTTREEYNKVKARVEELIAEATQKGMLESDCDNEYTREIGDLSKLMADYEDKNAKHLSFHTNKNNHEWPRIIHK